MKTLSMRLRLALWYSAMLAVALCLFGVSAYFGMEKSIHITVDEELSARMDGVRTLLEHASRPGYTENLEDSLREHSELRTGGELMQVSDEEGHWLYRSEYMSRKDIPRPKTAAAKAYTIPDEKMPLRVLDKKIVTGNKSYLVQAATEMDDFYEALYRFKALLLVSIPLFLMCAIYALSLIHI